MKRLVVVGTSAGGIDALRFLAAGLPETFPAAICAVIHTSPDSPGVLPDILNRAGHLSVRAARDRQRMEPGHLYLAPPDHHLLVEPGSVRVTRGPRENGFRPAIDPLFRSAAQVYGPAAVGVILTGNLDDGTAGLWILKRLGGIAIVQSPDDALFPSMPWHALRHVRVDYSVPLSGIPSVLMKVTAEAAPDAKAIEVPEHLDVEVKIAKEENPREAGLESLGRPSPYACPECHGVLLELTQEGRGRFRCHIGHAYSVESLLAAIKDEIELDLDTAIRSLEEGALLMDRIARQLTESDQRHAAALTKAAAARARRQSEAVRSALLERVDEAVNTD